MPLETLDVSDRAHDPKVHEGLLAVPRFWGPRPRAADIDVVQRVTSGWINRASHVPTNVPTTRELSGFVLFRPPPPHSD